MPTPSTFSCLSSYWKVHSFFFLSFFLSFFLLPRPLFLLIKRNTTSERRPLNNSWRLSLRSPLSVCVVASNSKWTLVFLCCCCCCCRRLKEEETAAAAAAAAAAAVRDPIELPRGQAATGTETQLDADLLRLVSFYSPLLQRRDSLLSRRREGITSIDRKKAMLQGLKGSFIRKTRRKRRRRRQQQHNQEKNTRSCVCLCVYVCVIRTRKEKGLGPVFKRPKEKRKKKKRHKFVHDLGTAPLFDIQHNKIEIIIMKKNKKKTREEHTRWQPFLSLSVRWSTSERARARLCLCILFILIRSRNATGSFPLADTENRTSSPASLQGSSTQLNSTVGMRISNK